MAMTALFPDAVRDGADVVHAKDAVTYDYRMKQIKN